MKIGSAESLFQGVEIDIDLQLKWSLLVDHISDQRADLALYERVIFSINENLLRNIIQTYRWLKMKYCKIHLDTMKNNLLTILQQASIFIS